MIAVAHFMDVRTCTGIFNALDLGNPAALLTAEKALQSQDVRFDIAQPFLLAFFGKRSAHDANENKITADSKLSEIHERGVTHFDLAVHGIPFEE